MKSAVDTQGTTAEELASIFVSIKRSAGISPASLHGMRRSQYLLLATIARRAEAAEPTVSVLSEELGITPAAITHLVNSLEARGHLQREGDPGDRRRVVLRITQDGRRFIDGVRADALASISHLVEYLGEADSRELVRLLRKSVEYFSHQAETT